MSWWKKLFGSAHTSMQKTQAGSPSPDGSYRISESAIRAIVLGIGSPDFPATNADAADLFATLNPSWSRTQHVMVVRASRELEMNSETIDDLICLIDASEHTDRLWGGTVYAQPAAHQRQVDGRSRPVAAMFFTCTAKTGDEPPVVELPPGGPKSQIMFEQ